LAKEFNRSILARDSGRIDISPVLAIKPAFSYENLEEATAIIPRILSTIFVLQTL